MCNKDDNEKELEIIEDKLIKEAQDQHKEEMLVSGKSVFEIKRIKDGKKGVDKSQ